jgi:hypothetical protein
MKTVQALTRTALLCALWTGLILACAWLVAGCYHGSPPGPCDPHCLDVGVKLDGGAEVHR